MDIVRNLGYDPVINVRNYEDPYMKLAMGIVEEAIKDLVKGYTHMLKEFGRIIPGTFDNYKELEDCYFAIHDNRHHKPIWLVNYESADQFLGLRTWYYELTTDLDPRRVKELAEQEAREEAMDIFNGKKKAII